MSANCSTKTIQVSYLATGLPEIPVEDLCHHPCELAHFIINLQKNNHAISRSKTLKFLAAATFSHPVLLPFTQNCIERFLKQQSMFAEVKYTDCMTVLLEALNVFCQIKGFSFDLLNISEPPKAQSQYQLALWANCLPSLSGEKYEKHISSHISEFSEEVTVQVKEFLH